jgi:hypothetical protein
MLDYVKLILEKVSFDQFLFEKELKKSIKQLIREELDELKNWCYQNFSQYLHIIKKCFA